MDRIDEMDGKKTSPYRPLQRSGLTLVELLVVVIILTTLVAAALPVMAPSSETRRLREAARSLNTMITTAQTKATELGRPYGIWLEKASAARLKGLTAEQASQVMTQESFLQDRGAVTTVFYCEEPPAFGGYDEQSAVVLRLRDPRTPNQFIAVFGRYEPLQSPQFVPQPLPPSIFRPDDRVVIEEKEFRILPPQNSLNVVDEVTGFLIESDRFLVEYVGTPGPFLYVSYSPGQGTGLTGDQWTFPQPYLIRRQPQKIDDPLQLPAGIAIDLEASGDRSTFFHDPLRPTPNSNNTPVAILFSPGGAIHSVFRNQGGDGLNTGEAVFFNDAGDGPVYLMVAKREQVGESQLDVTKTSWVDPESLWVTVSPQTGRVTSEVNSVNSFAPTAVLSDYQQLVVQRRDSRAFARTSQNMGGR